MGTETVDTTRCRDEVRRAADPVGGNGSHRPVSQPQAFHVTLVRALTAPWRALISTDESDERLVTEECCEYEWYDDGYDEASLAECARRALEAEHITDLSDVLADFASDLDTLRSLAIDDDARFVTEPVERHPVVRLYARRVAQLAGVALAGDEEVGRARGAGGVRVAGFAWAGDGLRRVPCKSGAEPAGTNEDGNHSGQDGDLRLCSATAIVRTRGPNGASRRVQ